MAETLGLTVLQCPMNPNESRTGTIGGYLLALAQTCWHEGEGFSGKYPFGDSGWEYVVYEGLAKANLISSVYDAQWGTYTSDSFDEAEGNRLIDLAFDYLYEIVKVPNAN